MKREAGGTPITGREVRKPDRRATIRRLADKNARAKAVSEFEVYWSSFQIEDPGSWIQLIALNAWLASRGIK